MGNLGLVLWGMAIVCLLPGRSFAQQASHDFPLERLIEDYIGPYDLSAENRFRLAVYSELKGQYISEYQSLMLEFGSLAKLTFYRGNCLLRTADNRVYHLDQRRVSERGLAVMNRALDGIFDRILLMGNHNADPRLVAFVDDALARKNIEPFQKMYLRHVLIRYGYYDREYDRVIFHSDWLPEQNYAYRGPKDISIVERPAEPLKIKLDAGVIRGYYLNSGGTVYVEDVDRTVSYASGEETSDAYNVHAFKLFAMRLFTQTTQYIVGSEQTRLDRLDESIDVMIRDAMAISDKETASPPTPLLAQLEAPTYAANGNSRGLSSDQSSRPSPRLTDLGSSTNTPIAAFKRALPYTKYDWIPMMLAQLRARGINIGDRDVIQYFVDHPDFQRLYKMLTPKEKAKVDRYDD